MRRSSFCAVLLLLVLAQAAVGYAVDCGQVCADEGPAGCEGDEGCCSCCFHGRTLFASRASAASPAAVWSDVGIEDDLLPHPAPREILHVPKARLLSR
jgi:hypothetical protein